MNRLGPLIATGGTAEIYAWSEDKVVKLYWNGAAASAAALEAAHASAAHAAGAPTPAVVELVTVDGRPGVVFERAQGPSMQETLFAEPQRAEELARQFAELHAGLHQRTPRDLPSQHQHLTRRIKLASIGGRARSMVLSALKTLPARTRLVSRRLSSRQRIVDLQGPDDHRLVRCVASGIRPVTSPAPAWSCSTRRRPTRSMHKGKGSAETLRSTFNAAYLDHYRRLRSLGPEQLKAWMLPVASARLTEPISPHKRAALLRLIDGLMPTVTS